MSLSKPRLILIKFISPLSLSTASGVLIIFSRSFNRGRVLCRVGIVILTILVEVVIGSAI